MQIRIGSIFPRHIQDPCVMINVLSITYHHSIRIDNGLQLLLYDFGGSKQIFENMFENIFPMKFQDLWAKLCEIMFWYNDTIFVISRKY